MTVDVANLTITWEGAHSSSPQQLFPATTFDSDTTISLTDFGEALDLGVAEWYPFSEPRALMDGHFYYGGVFSEPVELSLPLHIEAPSFERARAVMHAIDRLFSNSELGRLRVTRDDGGDELTLWLDCYRMRRPNLSHAPKGGFGHVGRSDLGRVSTQLKLMAPYPHWKAEGPETSGPFTWTNPAAATAFTIPNDGVSDIGAVARIDILSSGVGAVTLTNTTTGRYITITHAFSSGDQVTINWFGTDPDTLSVTKEPGSVDLLADVNVGALLRLVEGDNAMTLVANAGSVRASIDRYEERDNV